jgi:hypothetical protein
MTRNFVDVAAVRELFDNWCREIVATTYAPTPSARAKFRERLAALKIEAAITDPTDEQPVTKVSFAPITAESITQAMKKDGLPSSAAHADIDPDKPHPYLSVRGADVCAYCGSTETDWLHIAYHYKEKE